MLEKIRNKIAWICVTLIISGVLFIVLDFTGDILLILLGVFLFIFLFVPIEFFIIPYKKESPSQRMFSYLRGICFLLLAIGTVFSVGNYPGAFAILILNIITSLVLVFTLWKKEKIVIKQPIIIVLLFIITITNLIELSQFVNIHNRNLKYYTSLTNLNVLNSNAEIEFKFWSNQKSKNKFESNVLNKIEDAEIKIVEIIEKNAFNGRKISFENLKKTNFLSKHYLDIDNLKKAYQVIDTSIFFDSEISKYFKEFRTNNLLRDDFDNLLDPGQILIQLQLIKFMFLKEQIISFRILNNMINKDIEEMERKELKIIFEENKYAGETSKTDLKTKSFLKILLINYVLIFIMFFVPTLKILDKWKIRILLLVLVFIFEFILFIVDYFLQILSQNLLLLIAVNIVLAIGLVVLDGFLRRNFLKWYDSNS